MELVRIIILGIVQGLTEFIPVSSSGHLVLFQHLFGVQERLTLNVFLHFGTLISVVIVFWSDIIEIVKLKPKYRKLTFYLLLGTIPAGVIGVLFEDYFEQLFSSVTFVGFMLLITGLLLWLSDRIELKRRNLDEMKLSDSLLVGFAQAVAILPGISRSGATIVTGLFKGLDRKLAARYSFLLSIPVIAGASLIKAVDLVRIGLGEIGLLELTLGTATSAVSGYFAIRLLIKLINQERLSIFAYYCWVLAVLIILLT
ncbi:undecaprenyl-diphosphate phosphatase [Natroniella acetigena]|uniref:undecaprenyl-diphosphate phosphatase n=1 Tax=Natroniella acetigena TaxID=52004 RepID=UPI00200A5B70|nr:undecaprenyl-diphosphate phosphatase [Natroniella acetigena]MCK8826944.1 undecaprenyl-diphosphate phosphatase [Natroniella acetigena]